jgi:predicted PurR-regulated permease PerM
MSGVVDTAIIIALISLAGMLLVPLIAGLIQKIPTRQDALSASTKTIEGLISQVRELSVEAEKDRERYEKLEARFDRMQLDMRKFRNAYAKAHSIHP